MSLLGHYVSCDDALCIDCFPGLEGDPIVTGEITADDPLAIFSDDESDTPTHCVECEALIPHRLTSAGLACVREAAGDYAGPHRYMRTGNWVVREWVAHYL